jgi:phage/conjugal plasmid C-4 type zinc finger TraR family protein
MFDDMDRAQALDLARIEAIQESARRHDLPDACSPKECIDCADPIPAARRRAVPGAMRCTFCQAQAERSA